MQVSDYPVCTYESLVENPPCEHDAMIVPITGFSQRGKEIFSKLIEIWIQMQHKVFPRNMPDHGKGQLLRADTSTWPAKNLETAQLGSKLNCGREIRGVSFSAAAPLVLDNVREEPHLFSHVCLVDPALGLKWYIVFGAWLYYFVRCSSFFGAIALILTGYDSILSIMGCILLLVAFLLLPYLKIPFGPDYVHTDEYGNETFYSGIPAGTGAQIPGMVNRIWKRFIAEMDELDLSHIQFTIILAEKSGVVDHSRAYLLADKLGITPYVVPNAPHNVLPFMTEEQLLEAFADFNS